MRKCFKLLSLILLLISAISLTACGSDEPENGDVYYVTTYEVKMSPNTLIGFIPRATYVDENGDRVTIDLSNSIAHFIPLTTTRVPDFLQIHLDLTRRTGLNEYDCVVDLGIEVKKYTRTGEYLETVYSKQNTACSIESYPAKEMDANHFVASFTLQAKKDRHGKLR